EDEDHDHGDPEVRDGLHQGRGGNDVVQNGTALPPDDCPANNSNQERQDGRKANQPKCPGKGASNEFRYRNKVRDRNAQVPRKYSLPIIQVLVPQGHVLGAAEEGLNRLNLLWSWC